MQYNEIMWKGFQFCGKMVNLLWNVYILFIILEHNFVIFIKLSLSSELTLHPGHFDAEAGMLPMTCFLCQLIPLQVLPVGTREQVQKIGRQEGISPSCSQLFCWHCSSFGPSPWARAGASSSQLLYSQKQPGRQCQHQPAGFPPSGSSPSCKRVLFQVPEILALALQCCFSETLVLDLGF